VKGSVKGSDVEYPLFYTIIPVKGSDVEYPLFYTIIPQIITKNKQQWQENQELNWQDIIILLIVTDHRSDV